MEKSRIGLIRVLTTDDPKILDLHGNLIMEFFPGLEVITRCIPGQPQGVFDEASEEEAWPKVVDLAQEMAADDVEVIIVSCRPGTYWISLLSVQAAPLPMWPLAWVPALQP